nr:MAG TPA: tail fiber protein [Caudoviricetes sp.]
MIEQTVARVVYQGDGRTKEFPFAFPVLDRKFIVVVISDRHGREKTLTSDYYVDMDKHVVLYPGYPKGEEPAEAERPAVLAPGEKIVIYRNTQVSQLTSLGDKWPFDVCEKALDKLTMIDQENKESISRTVRLAGATEEVEVILPPPERDTAIGWSEDGKSVINVPVKRWQEEARAAAEKAQTQASMAMTYKEESKEARSKAEQSEEKARDYANRAVLAETKVRGYATSAEEKHNAFTKLAKTAKNEINALNEEVKEGVILTGEAQRRLIKEDAAEAIESVRKQGIDEMERVKEQGDSAVSRVWLEGNVQKSKVEAVAVGMVDAAQKAQSGAETKAKEARTAADEAKAVLKTAMGGVDLTEYAKKESLVGLASTEYVDGRIKHVVGTAPEALDTLGEIATALTTNKDKIGTIITEISTKADKGTVENALMGKATKEELAKKADKDTVYTKLGKEDAQNTYLSKTDAANKYLSKNSASAVYVKKSDLPNSTVKKANSSDFATTAGALSGDNSLYNYLRRHNNTPLPKTNAELNKLGIFTRYFAGDGQIDNQPTTWGQLINFPAGMDNEESCQFWIEQSAGKLYHRGGNGANKVNDIPFTRILDEYDVYDNNMLKLPNGAKIGVE